MVLSLLGHSVVPGFFGQISAASGGSREVGAASPRNIGWSPGAVSA